MLAGWGRVFAAAAGIALALILALYLDAVFRGEAANIVTFVERTPGDVWVLQKGVDNLHMSVSAISENTIVDVKRADGVRRTTRLVYRPSSIGKRGEEIVAYVVGVPEDPGVQKLWSDAAGWPAPVQGSVILPEPMLRAKYLRIGGDVRVGDRNFRIAGVSQGTFSMANPLVFVHERDARALFDIGDGASVLLVEAVAGVDPAALAARIEAETDSVRALPRSRLVDNDYDLAMQMGGALIGMLSLVGMGVSLLIIAFSVYAFVSARTAEFAVVKALGARRIHLVLSALLETGTVAVLGGLLALGAIGPLELALTDWVPQVAVDFSPAFALKLVAVMIVAAEVTALVPLGYVLRVDPAMVFKG